MRGGAKAIILQKCPKLVRGHSGISCDRAQCDRVDGIVPWNRETDLAVAHNDVSRFPDNLKAKFHEDATASR